MGAKEADTTTPTTDTQSAPLSDVWWHLYGAEIEGLAQSRETGEPRPGWMQVTLGECELGPDDLRESGEPVKSDLDFDSPHGKVRLPYIASWDHEPFPQEIAAVIPEKYRD